MAKFVLAGKADCPFYAIAEHLADTCQKCLPDFSVRKKMIDPEQWQSWLEAVCASHGWTVSGKSPLIWRDVGPGCRALLLGGLSDFMEHCQAFYNVTVEIPTELTLKISQENMAALLDQKQEEEERLTGIKPLHVWICSALSPLAPFLISELLQDAEVLPQSPLLSLHLFHLDQRPEPGPDQDLDQEPGQELLRALQMDTEDLAAPRLHQVSVHTSESEAFTNADLILLLDPDLDLDQDMDQDVDQDVDQEVDQEVDQDVGLSSHQEPDPDLSLFTLYGRLLQRSGSNARVLLFSNHAQNQKGSALLAQWPALNRRRFITTATHLVNHARVRIAHKLEVSVQDVRRVHLWGDVCSSFFVDVQRAEVYHGDRGVAPPAGVGLPLPHATQIRLWCNSELQLPVSHHMGALCCAHAMLSVLKAWDSPETELSAGVYCSGLQDIPDGLVSVPVQFSHGSWSFLSDVNEIREKIQKTIGLRLRPGSDPSQVCATRSLSPEDHSDDVTEAPG